MFIVFVLGKVNLCQLFFFSFEYDCILFLFCNDEVLSYDFGWFIFFVCSIFDDYQFVACKNDFLRCGVLIFDFFLIICYIFGLVFIFDFKMLIVVDVNGSGSIFVMD